MSTLSLPPRCPLHHSAVDCLFAFCCLWVMWCCVFYLGHYMETEVFVCAWIRCITALHIWWCRYVHTKLNLRLAFVCCACIICEVLQSEWKTADSSRALSDLVFKRHAKELMWAFRPSTNPFNHMQIGVCVTTLYSTARYVAFNASVYSRSTAS